MTSSLESMALEWLQAQFKCDGGGGEMYKSLVTLLTKVAAETQEKCAALHENINPASDAERLRGDPGAGAMGAIIEYRDAIRSMK